MKAIWLVAAIGACAVLSSCDQDQQTAQNAAPPPPPACACRPTTPQETAAAAQTAMPVSHRRHHHYWRSEHRDDAMAWNEHRHWRNDYSRTDSSESVLAPYDYVSQSSVSYAESEVSYASGAGYESREDYASGQYGMRYRGRRAYGGDTIAATMTGERLDPWHGYGVYCPQP